MSKIVIKLKDNYDKLRILGTDFVLRAGLVDKEMYDLAIRNGHRQDCFIVIENNPALPYVTADRLDSEEKIIEAWNALDIDFWQIYYDELSLSKVLPFAKLYDNTDKLTVVFENAIIPEIVLSSKSNYVGVFSASLIDKVNGQITQRRIIDMVNTYDLAIFHKQSGGAVNDLRLAENYHPNFIETFGMVADAIGLKWHLNKNKYNIYSNHFIARNDLYKQYVKEVLLPAIEVMADKSNSKLQKLLWQDSNYRKDDKKIAARLKELISVDYYPMHTFILERMPAFFFESLGGDLRVNSLN